MVSAVDLVSAPSSDNPYLKALIGSYAFRPGYQIVYALQGNPGDTALLGGERWAQHNAAQAFQQASAAWMAVANISITAATAGYDGTGSVSAYTWVEKLVDLGPDLLGQHSLPGPGALSGEFNHMQDEFTAAGNARGGYSFITFLHEIGHGLGLRHPHDPGNSFPGVDGDDDTGNHGLNQGIYTVMSYNDGYSSVQSHSDDWGWTATPMAFDIAAIQRMYGANMTTATGDNVYTLPTGAGPGTYWSCIWDVSGVDTITAGGTSAGCVIDLRAATLLDEAGGGGWISSISSVVGGFTIANGVVIENAIGGNGDDTLKGNDAANQLFGNGGNDTIRGYGGDDWIDAGTGSGAHSLYGDDGNDRIDASLTTGTNQIEGGSGDDWLIGGAGNDAFYGGSGIDRFWGGAGFDTFYVDSQSELIFENPDGGLDRVHSSVGFYLYANLEHLYLGDSATFGVGNELDNQITAGASGALLIGGDGNDYLQGNIGNDLLFGGSGADTLFGDAGIDYLVGGDGGDALYGTNGADALYGEAGNDTLMGGNDFATDILVGGDGNDELNGGGAGDYDLMDGGAGDDIYRVDTPDDLTFEALNGGRDTVYADIQGAGYYLYANVEDLILERNTPFGVGNELDNRLTGSNVSNWLLGGAGSDTLNGKGGNDVLFGEGGADIFVFERGTGGDVIGDFLAGTDRIDLRAYGLTTFAQVQALMVENGGTTAINLGNGDLIVLNGVANAALHAGDFILSGGSSGKAEARMAALEDLASPSEWFQPALWHGSGRIAIDLPFTA